MDPRVFQVFQNQQIINQLRSIDERLSAVEAQGVPFDRSKLFMRKTLDAGESGTVYDYRIWGKVGFINYVGCSWFPKTHYIWTIDNVQREKVERVYGNPIAPMSEPYRLSTPLRFTQNIRWVAFNDDTEAHVFDVYHDGILHSSRVAALLRGAQ